jgi:hypothetical protein
MPGRGIPRGRVARLDTDIGEIGEEAVDAK